MTEQNSELIYNPPARLRLADGSVWGSEEITDLRNRLNNAQSSRTSIVNDLVRTRQQIRDIFREFVDDGDLDVEKANEALESMNLEGLAVEWEFEVELTVRGYAKAATEDQVEEALNDASWSLDNYTSGVDDLDINEVEVGSVSTDRIVT